MSRSFLIINVSGSVSLHELYTIIRILNVASLCLGIEIYTDHDEVNHDNKMQLPVLGSHFVHVETEFSKNMKRLISSSCCLLVQSTGEWCKNCSYAHNVIYCNRVSKRKRAQETNANSSKCNARYLTRSGLESTLVQQKKIQRKVSGSAKKKGFKKGDEMWKATIKI